VINATLGDATNVEVMDQPDLDNLEITDLGGGTLAGDTITWQLGTLPGNGGADSVTFKAAVKCMVPDPTGGADMPMPDLTEICNDSFWVTSTETGDLLPITLPDCLTVNRPVLNILKERITPDPILAGDTVEYRFTVCNEGSYEANNITITDTLDASLDEGTIYAPGSTSVVGSTTTWDISQIAAGTPGNPACSQPFLFSADVNSGTPGQTDICNEAFITDEDIYGPCAWEYPSFEVCFVSADTEWPGCDVGSKFPLPWLKDIPAPSGQTDDTGLTDTSIPLCLYQVVDPTAGTTVRLMKNAGSPDLIDIYYW
jgi:uncharacterized repeat protein (TIGR01451 family)